MIFCRYCGSKNNSDAFYCRGCSAPFRDEYNKPDYVPKLYNDNGITGTLALYGFGTYLPTGSVAYFGGFRNNYVRTSIITTNEAREMLEIPQYQSPEQTRIEDLPDIKLLDKIKNRLMDWRTK